MSKLEVRAASSPWYSSIEFVIYNGTTAGKAIEFEECKYREQVKPTFSVPREAAQVLMDDLWNSGLRPTEGTGSAGSLRATEKHVDDLRKIAFKVLDIE